MLQWCMFGGYEGPLGPDRKVYFTMFGGCDLRRPTLARELLSLRQPPPAEAEFGRKMTSPPLGTSAVRRGRRIIITIFGGTEIKCPTLTEEFIDLREMVRSGALDLRYWEAYMAELARWQQDSIASFTLFGGFDETALPSEDEEVEALALHRHMGNIVDAVAHVLEMGVGQVGSQRRAVILQAVTAESVT